MGDSFKLEIVLDNQSMTDFGRYVALVCCEFPAVVQADVQALQALCAMEPVPMEAVREVLARMITNAGTAVRVGDGVATLIGRCTPERIDGGPIQ